ncbi:hypothetical protein ACHAXS_009444 [Conticribra weissflogii]
MATHSQSSNRGINTMRQRRIPPEKAEFTPTNEESSCSDSASCSSGSGGDHNHESSAESQNSLSSSASKVNPVKVSLVPSPQLTTTAGRLLPWLGLLVWPSLLALPLTLLHTYRFHYSYLFPRSWYALQTSPDAWLDKSLELGGIWLWPNDALTAKPLRHPLGLILGISAVAVGHLFLLVYFRLHHQQLLGPTTPIQSRGAPPYIYSRALLHHLSQPGGFFLLGTYLSVTWLLDLLPPSYYSFQGSIQYTNVVLCLLTQDLLQFLMHKLEHIAHPKLYRLSHKPHHKFTNPKLFDAFDGSVPDTVLMILLPLFLTAHIVRTCNVWTYMAFGSIYANWLTFIHSEVTFPWEKYFRAVGLGTAADHHVHHKFFKWNFGHLFLWWDWVAGSYRDPRDVWGKEFTVGV